MLIKKEIPKGIDIPIQRLQEVLYKELKKKWGISDDISFDCYGRAYRNQTSDGYVPEVYKKNGEYADVLFDDKLKALCFFGISDTQQYDAGSSLAKVFLIFMVNVKELKPGITHRGDEEIRVDAEEIACIKRHGFTLTGIETSLDRVFKEYSGWRVKDGIKFNDMHPLHCFRMNFDLLYNIFDC
jgi:hypothetical protein